MKTSVCRYIHIIIMKSYLTPQSIFEIELESLKYFKEYCEKYESQLLDGYKNVNKNRCKSFIDFCCMVYCNKLQSGLFTFGAKTIESQIDTTISYYDRNDNSVYNK